MVFNMKACTARRVIILMNRPPERVERQRIAHKEVWLALNHIDNPSFGLAVALDIALGHLQGGMPRKLLDIAQRASGFDNFLCRIGYERPAS
jgi:hypothetical protein